jgi:NADH:ubiquinone oxidoreductase subunit C
LKTERSEMIPRILEMKKSGFDYLVKMTAVDNNTSVQVVYILRNMEENKVETVEVDLQNNDLWVPTLIDHYKAADWYEREMSEMFGIEIRGRVAKRLLLEKWDGKDAPLRKSFTWNAPYKTSQ